MVEELDLEEVSGADEVAGDANVGLGRAGISRGVVVGEDDGMGTRDDRGTEDLARMDEDLVEESLGDGLDAEEAAAGVDEEDLEAFHGGGDGVVAEDGGDGLGVVEDRGFLAKLLGQALGEGEGGLEGEGLVPADARHAELLPWGAGDGLKVAEAMQQGFGYGEGGGSADAGAEQNGDELGGAEGIGASLGEPFARAVGKLEVMDALMGLHEPTRRRLRRCGGQGWGEEGWGCRRQDFG